MPFAVVELLLMVIVLWVDDVEGTVTVIIVVGHCSLALLVTSNSSCCFSFVRFSAFGVEIAVVSEETKYSVLNYYGYIYPIVII